MRNLLRSIKIGFFMIALLLLLKGQEVKATTYYLTPTGAGSAQTASSWNTNPTGGGTSATNFSTSGDIFIIPSGINGIVSDNWNFGSGNVLTLMLTIDGSLTINSGSVLTLIQKNQGTNTMTVNGRLIFLGTAVTNQLVGATNGSGGASDNTFILSSGALLITANADGIYSKTNGSINSSNLTPSLSPGANYEFNGAGQATNGLPTSVNNLTFSGSGTKTLQTGTTNITGNFTVDDVTTTAVTGLTIGGDVILNRNFSFSGGAFTHNVAGNWTNNGWGTFNSSGGTINFTGNTSNINGSQTTQTFNNLIIAKTSGQILGIGGNVTTLNINGNLTLTSGAFAQGTIPTIISGNWINNGGTLIAGAGTITMNGSGKTIGGTTSTTFNNLTINNNAGGILLANNQTINGTLTLSNGLLKLVSYNLTLGASASAVSGTGWTGNMIVADGAGTVRKIFTGNGSYTFPIGDNSDGTANYTPITLNFTSGTHVGGAYAAVRVTDAKHPSNTSPTNYLTRYWTVSQSGISSFSCDVTGIYEFGGDVVGQEGLQTTAEYTGSLPWITYSALASNILSASGVNSFGDFTGISIPTITVSTTSLAGFTYAIGAGPSAQQQFTVSGVNLTSDLIVTPPTDYEISTGSGFQSTPITFTQSGGFVYNKDIYVRLKAGLSSGSYNSENAVVSSVGATGKNVTLSGVVTSTAVISTGSISGSSFCAGAAVAIPFTITGSFTSGNTFTAQLSDASGSFTSPVTIGSITSTSAGTIIGTIPVGAVSGSGYRIRVVSSTPSITGTNNGTDITVTRIPSAATAISGLGSVTQGQTGVTYSVAAISNATSYVWAYSGSGATINGSGNTVTIDFASNATSGNLTVYGANGCGNGTVSSNFPISVTPPSTSDCSYGDNTSSGIVFVPCINIPANPETVTTSFTSHQYFLLNVIKGLNYQVYTCSTPSTGLKMAVYEEGNPSGAVIASSNSNTGNTCNTNANNVYLSFVSTISGQVRILINTKTNCASTSETGLIVNVNVRGGSNTLDNPNDATTNNWTGHIYDGNSFNNYLGYYTQTETFKESFGTGGTWPDNPNDDVTCFNNINSNGDIRASLKDGSFSVRYLMRSTKHGLYRVDLTGDDGNRLFVDGVQVYSDWSDHSPRTNSSVLIPLSGNSLLAFEYYENGGQNVIGFNNLIQVLDNELTSNISQTVCLGNSGSAIDGDTYGTLPSGINPSGTGYQWTYSTTLSGSRVSIAGATGATYTPNTSVAPFNATGTFYIFRNATLSSTNNVAPNPYIATNESNPATLIVVNQGSADPTSASASLSTICEGTNTTLTLNGGGGTSGETIRWYSGSCGGTFVGNGNNLVVSPTATTTYYGRYENGAPCNYNSACASVAITVNPDASIGSVSGTSPLCIGSTATYTANAVVPGGGSGSWSSSNTGIATVNPTTGLVTALAVGTCNIIYTISGGCGGTPIKQQSLTVEDPIGDPSVFGSNTWNVYAYQGSNIGLNGITYKGYYTEPNFSFSTTVRWSVTGSPDEATGYQGCDVTDDNHTFVYKREGFAAGTYQITVGHDDGYQLYIDGVLVSSAGAWDNRNPEVLPDLYSLNTSSKIEFRVAENGGDSRGSLTFTLQCANPTAGGTIDGTQVICSGRDPVAFTSIGLPTGHTGTLEYKWQSSTVNGSSGFADVTPGATALTYDAPGGLTQTTWYKRLARVSCTADWSGAIESNVIEVTVKPQPTLSGITATPSSVCDGDDVAVTVSGLLNGTNSINYDYTVNGSTNTIDANLTATGGVAEISLSNLTTGSYSIKVNNITVNGCVVSFISNNLANWTVVAQPVADDITPNVAAGNVCAGQSLSATFGGASGGTGTITDVHEFSINGGSSFSAYSSAINTAGFAGQTVIIRTRRTATGPGCVASAYKTISWTVYPDFNSGGILTSGETICYNGDPGIIGSSASASGGDGTISYQWQSSTDNFATTPTNISNNSPTYNPPANLTVTTWYRRQAKDGACNTSWNTSTGVWKVTVIPNNTAGAPSSTPTLCVNTTLTAITIATTGATGIGTPLNLPSGVNATWGSNTITITGTPAESGTFNYSIPLIGGCGTFSATGSITVNSRPTPTISGDFSPCNKTTDEVYETETGMSNYSWTISAGGTITSGQGTKSITVSWNVDGSQSLGVSYTNGNGCSGSSSSAISVHTIPSIGGFN